MYVFPKSHEKSHFQELEPTNPTLVASATKWLIHLLLLEAPISAQATAYRMKLTSVDGGGNLFNRKMVVVDPLRLGPETYLGKSYLKEGICYYIHICYDDTDLRKNFQSVTCFHQSVYLFSGIIQSSEHTIFHII